MPTPSSLQYGPDRATYRHWLDRDNRPVIGPASVLRTFRNRFGAPTSIARRPERTVYVWQNGFDRHAVSVFRLFQPSV